MERDTVRTIRTVFVLALLIALVPARVHAATDEVGDGPLDRVAGRLELDEATRAAIRDVVESTRMDASETRSAIRQARATLARLLAEDSPDEAAVMAQAEVVSDLELQARKQRLAAMIRIRKLLTPAQRAGLVGMRRERFRRTVAACRGDVEALCPDAEGLRESVRCLVQNREQVSAGCTEALATGPLGRLGRF